MKRIILTCCSIVYILLTAGQIPVRLEPRHHNVLDNGYVRLLDVRIPPHDTSLIHIHETPSIFIIIDNVKTGSQIIKEGNNPAGNALFSRIWYDAFTNGPRIHRVWNSDTSQFHVMDIELVRKDPINLVPMPVGNNFELLFNEKQANGYLLALSKNESWKAKETKARLLIVVLDPTHNNFSVNGKILNKGDFIFYNKGISINIQNNNPDPVHTGIFEIK